ncbi:glycerophosphoryl diester phosphodiesterase membrane domain-containing protein [Microbacterium sp. P07]|uniref:glycerophosphoryl diester phosphodiesterase membrane domain-containing protein n=1 Tax=Microbacterium sp. P07 TaxID=3366952 RepID=UPI003744B792
MTAYPAWTPASRPGIVPLHPLGFGTILGRSFVALRQNPKVLLGFALCVQVVGYLVLLAAIGGVALASFSRLETLQPGTDDFDAVLAGSIAATGITAFVFGLGSQALGVIVQGVVVSEVASAVIAEKPTLGEVWRRVKPVAWRLVGYSFLLAFATLLVIAVVGALLFAVGLAALPLAIVLGILAVLGAIPLSLWLTTKLLLVPAVIILEHARIRDAVPRSWRLTRDRFWSTLGVLVIVSVTFSAIAQVVSIPLSLVSTGFTTVISPTGEPEPGAIVGFIVSTLLTQAATLLVQCVAVIVQSTATALIYVDCRMRHEGLDLDLRAYVERRDAGATDLADPFRENVGRVVGPRPPQYGYPAPGYAAPGYGAPAYPAPGYPPAGGFPAPYPPQPQPQPQPQGAAPQGVPNAAAENPAQTAPAQTDPAAAHTPSAPAPAPPADAAPTRWAAPGDGS